MKYLNTNTHRVYVDDPDNDESDLTTLRPGEEVEAEGAFADNLEATSGIVRADSDEGKAHLKGEKTKQSPGLPPGHEEVLAIHGGASAAPEGESLEDMKKNDLVALAKEREIEVPPKATKAELVEALSSGGGGTMTSGDAPAKQ